MKTAALFALPLLFGCDSPPEPIAAPPAPVVPQPPPPFEEQGDEILWRPAGNTGEFATVHFDNGTDRTVSITLAEDARFELPKNSRRRLRTTADAVDFAVAVGDKVIERHKQTLHSSHVYVYNVDGRWDYTLESVNYSEIAMPAGLRSGGQRRTYEAAVFFHVGPQVDYEFEPLPTEIEVTKNADEFMAPDEKRTRLDRQGENPHPERTIRRPQGAAWSSVVEGPGLVSVQPVGATDGKATIIIDSSDRTPTVLRVDGADATTIEARGWIRLIVAPGEHTLEAIGPRGKLRDNVSRPIHGGGRYLWNPGGKARYRVEHAAYGQPVVPRLTSGQRPPTKLEERGFFEVSWDLVFEPFPDAAPVDILGATTMTRLTRKGRP